MKVLIRTTAQGTEYWDNVSKKVLFVAVGEEPDFDVTENPKSMIIGVDLANDPDKVVVINPLMDFESMTVKQLKEYAESNDIEIPADIIKKDDIINFLSDTE